MLPRDLAGAEQDPWQPRCIARAFATPREAVAVFTMQTWIDLDAARSPLLEGVLPQTGDGLDAAIDAFRCGPVDLTPEEAVGLGLMMLDAIHAAFAMRLEVTPPGGDGDARSRGLAGGFGDWLPIYAALVAQLGLSIADANALPVGKALALLASHRRNCGWMPAGATYAQRDEARAPAPPFPVTPNEEKEEPHA